MDLKNMRNFKTFLLNESFSTELTLQQTADYIVKHCIESFQAEPIYRGITSYDNFMLCDPTKKERRSLGTTHNFYTLIISHSERWKAYPPRNGCLIASTSKKTADTYGQIYRMFYPSDAKFGICPSNDFWHCFDDSLHELFLSDMYSLNGVLAAYLKFLKENDIVEAYANDNYSATYDTMVRNFKIVDEALKGMSLDALLNVIEQEQHTLNMERFAEMTKKFKHSGSMLKSIDELLDPVENNFKLNQIPRGDREIWTDATCVVVYDGQMKKLEELIEKMLDES